MSEPSSILEIRGLTRRFGGLTAVDGLDLDVNDGEIVSLVGPNGAGKTTVFNLISGVLRPTSGRNTVPPTMVLSSSTPACQPPSQMMATDNFSFAPSLRAEHLMVETSTASLDGLGALSPLYFLAAVMSPILGFRAQNAPSSSA